MVVCPLQSALLMGLGGVLESVRAHSYVFVVSAEVSDGMMGGGVLEVRNRHFCRRWWSRYISS